MANLDAPLNNSPYDDEELTQFQELILEEKEQAEEEINKLKESVDDLTGTENDEYSSAAHHQGNVASEVGEKETLLKLIERNKNKIKEIKAALDRIEKGNYGICEETGQKIQQERLKAIPYARYSVEARKKDDRIQSSPRI